MADCCSAIRGPKQLIANVEPARPLLRSETERTRVLRRVTSGSLNRISLRSVLSSMGSGTLQV
jgi:hypothetical protein